MTNQEAARSSAKIGDVQITQTHEAGAVTLGVEVRLEALEQIHYKVSFALSPALCNGKRIPRTQVFAKTALVMKGNDVLSTQIRVENPRLWNRDGGGDQTEYSLRVSLKPAGIMAGGAAAAQITQIKALDEKEYAVRIVPQNR